MDKNVLRALDMKESTFQQPLSRGLQDKATPGHDINGRVIKGKWHIYPEKGAAGLWTTPTDLGNFLIAMFEIYEGKRNYPIDKNTQYEMFKQIKNSQAGLGVFLAGNFMIFHLVMMGKMKVLFQEWLVILT